MKTLKAKYGHPFVYKPHDLCLQEAHMVCATSFKIEILNGGGYSVFDLDYVVISPYKTRSQICLWLRPLE